MTWERENKVSRTESFGVGCTHGQSLSLTLLGPHEL